MEANVKGFTLIELLITIAVISIIAAVGLPGFASYTQINRTASQINLVSGSLSLARSEAIKRGLNVVMCASNNATSNPPTCSTTAWNNGWIVFVDRGNTGNYDSTKNDVLLAVNGKFTGGLTMKFDTGTPSNPTKVYAITFTANGGLLPSQQPGVFTLCRNSNTSEARSLNLSIIGMVDIEKGTNFTCP